MKDSTPGSKLPFPGQINITYPITNTGRRIAPDYDGPAIKGDPTTTVNRSGSGQRKDFPRKNAP